MPSCRHAGCNFKTKEWYSLSKHEPRCRWREQDGVTTVPTKYYHEEVCDEMVPRRPNPSAQIIVLPSNQSDQEPDMSQTHMVAACLSEIEEKAGAKLVDELISLLRNRNYSHSEFMDNILSARQCLTLTRNMFNNHLDRNGFAERRIFDNTGRFWGTMYARNPIDVLRKQIQACNESNTFFQPVCMVKDNARMFYHPLHTPFCEEVYKHTVANVMKDPSRDVFWHTDGANDSKSFVGYLQLYSDKSSTTMKASGLVSYPIHITLLNFHKEYRNTCIMSGETILAYLPVNISPHEESIVEESGEQRKGTVDRSIRMNILHNSISAALERLTEVCMKGFLCTDSSGCSWNCHPTLLSFCADIPEAKDLTSILGGTKTCAPCHRCMVSCENLNCTTKNAGRSQEDTLERREQYAKRKQAMSQELSANHHAGARQAKENAEATLSVSSISSQPSFLETSPLIPRMETCNMYAAFTFEPMHNLHLGISKLIKQCMYTRFSSEQLYLSLNKRRRTFRSVRNSLLRCANHTLSAIERDSFMPGLHVDFSTCEKGATPNGLFTVDGLRGMLEAKDYWAVDMVFPFVAGCLDRICGESDSAPLTTICTRYTEIVTSAMRYGYKKEWTEYDIQELESMVRDFKRITLSVLGDHHATQLKTLKFHLLDHLGNDIRRMGSLQAVDAGVYEHAHLIFKRQYQRTSKRRCTATSETIHRIEDRNYRNGTHKRKGESEEKRRSHIYKHFSALKMGANLVRDGETTTIAEFILCCTAAEALSGTSVKAAKHQLQKQFSTASCNLFMQMDITALSMLKSMLERDLREVHRKSSHNTKITVVRSAMVAGGFQPSLQDYDTTTNTLCHRQNHFRTRQRIFATHEFGPNKKPRYSFILLRGDNNGVPITWVGKLVALLRVKTDGNDELTTDYAYVQYMEVTRPLDYVDEVLNCVCLRWSTADEIDHTIPCLSNMRNSGNSSSSPWFGLVKANTVLGSVHVVRQKYEVKPFTKHIAWEEQRFYINRFYRDPGPVIGEADHFPVEEEYM